MEYVKKSSIGMSFSALLSAIIQLHSQSLWDLSRLVSLMNSFLSF